ncbi:MAG: acyl-CoA thioesterase [Thermoleophilia bacterium]|nr:acyl-CoA thioesterase [Thermoleophilia bacterium]
MVLGAGADDRRPPFRFCARTRVDFADTDAGGVLYYGRWAHYLDRAVIAYRRHLGLGLLGEPGHLAVVRALSVAYHASARFDDPLEVFVRTARIGRTSQTLDVRLERPGPGGAGEHLADGRLVVVGVDAYDTARPTPVPDPVRARVAAFEGEALEQAP